MTTKELYTQMEYFRKLFYNAEFLYQSRLIEEELKELGGNVGDTFTFFYKDTSYTGILKNVSFSHKKNDVEYTFRVSSPRYFTCRVSLLDIL